MSAGFAIAVAILGPFVGVVHSSFASKYDLANLYPNDPAKRQIITLIWHLPSLTWSALAFAVLAARLDGASNALVTIIAVFIYVISGLGNLLAHRKPFIGGILLLVAGALTAMDWLANH